MTKYRRAILIILVLMMVGCSPQKDSKEIQYVEVTREVKITDIIEVTSTFLPPTQTLIEQSVKSVDALSSLFVGGNQSPILEDGDPDTVAVLTVGEPQGSIIPMVFRNNMDQSIFGVSVSTVGRAADGTLIATGSDQGLNPYIVNPGEIFFGYIYFGSNANLANIIDFDFNVDATFVNPDMEIYKRDFEVLEHNQTGNQIVGLLKNSSEALITGPIGVNVICFNQEGDILGHYSSFTDSDRANPGASISFNIDLLEKDCPIYLIASSGYLY